WPREEGEVVGQHREVPCRVPDDGDCGRASDVARTAGACAHGCRRYAVHAAPTAGPLRRAIGSDGGNDPPRAVPPTTRRSGTDPPASNPEQAFSEFSAVSPHLLRLSGLECEALTRQPHRSAARGQPPSLLGESVEKVVN